MAALPEILQRALAGRYRIERELGRGGMATVFLAEDLRHRRRVAIKVLDPEVAGAIGPGRFLREIETVANLTHPHILPLHDSGEADGLLYYVMPYVEGGSLRQRLVREKQLGVDEALRITREVAEALGYAHRAGVVHRDVKPENVLLHEGHALLADFGIARAAAAAGPETLTATGMAVGTPAYMSPEQASGSREVDGRSDEYSLGCVLYELLAGVPPFVGPTAESVARQHLSVAPRAVTELRPTVPPGVSAAIQRSLEKVAADRYATLAEFTQALGSPGTVAGAGPAVPAGESTPIAGMASATPTPVPTPKPQPAGALRWVAALAVLAAVAWVGWKAFGPKPLAGPVKQGQILVAAFEGPPEDSSLAVASRELISAAIDQSRVVVTVPRDMIRDALRAAGRPSNTRVDGELARELAVRLSVRTVLEGQVGRVGTGYSIVLRMVNADSAHVVLTETGTAKNADALIPALGDVAKRLRRDMGESRAALAATRNMALVATPSFEAYKHYARARQLGGFRGLAEYRAALALDPDFAMAWAAMGHTYFNLGYMDSLVLVLDKALSLRDRLTERDRTRLQAFRMVADGDWEGAAGIYDRALMENPDDLWALGATSADLLWNLGRYEDALARNRRLQQLRPFGPSQVDYTNEAIALTALGRIGEARSVGEKLTGLWRNFVLAELAMNAGDFAAAESLAMLQDKNPLYPVENIGGTELVLTEIYRACGRIAEMDSVLARSWKLAENPDYGWGDRPAQYRRELKFDVLCLGRKPPPIRAAWPDTIAIALVIEGLRSAYLGDVETARRCLHRAEARPRRERRPEGPPLTLLEATLAGAEGRWGEAASRLQPIAVQRFTLGTQAGATGGEYMSWIRWTLADDYEHLGKPDSAAAQLERITRDPLAIAFRPYASLRLVPLYAKLGRGADARRHWALAMYVFQNPDPVLRPRIEEARAALARTM